MTHTDPAKSGFGSASFSLPQPVECLPALSSVGIAALEYVRAAAKMASTRREQV